MPDKLKPIQSTAKKTGMSEQFLQGFIFALAVYGAFKLVGDLFYALNINTTLAVVLVLALAAFYVWTRSNKK